MFFTAEGEWKPALEPLHIDIDLRKRHRCGVGPALVCARTLMELRIRGRDQRLPRSRIGLIPCAIGGASLDEWQKTYKGVVGDCEVPRADQALPAAEPKAKGPWEYKPGASNLFEAMAARAEGALRDAPEGSSLAGMLWYQGETDAMEEQTAESYLDRFGTFVEDVRALGYPDLKIFTVAVTTTTNRLPYLAKVREAQFAAASRSGIVGVYVQDAFGLPMLTDGLHLTTQGQVELGVCLALQVHSVSGPKDEVGLPSPPSPTGRSRADASVEASFEDTSRRARRVLDELRRLEAAVVGSRPDEQGCVVSEVDFKSFARLLFFLEPRPEHHLLLLGWGAGSALGAALLYRLSSIQVIDPKKGSLEGARALVSAYSKDPHGVVARIQAPYDPHIADKTTAATTHGATSPSKIHLDTGNLVDKDWSQQEEVDILFASSESFDDALMMDIARHCRAHLPSTSKVVTLAKPLPLYSSAEAHQNQASPGEERAVEDIRDNTSGRPTPPEGEWKVLWQCQVQASWGETLVAYVHHFVPSASA